MVNCAFTENELTDEKFAPGQEMVQTELYAHGHPKSKRVNGPNTPFFTTFELREILIEHYRYAHQNN